MKGQALRPDFLLKSLPSLQKAEDIKSGITDEDRAYHSMAQSRGWQQLVEFKNSLLSDMDRVNKQAIANGLNYEQIGQNTVIINMATEIIDRLFFKVSDAVEACEQNAK